MTSSKVNTYGSVYFLGIVDIFGGQIFIYRPPESISPIQNRGHK